MKRLGLRLLLFGLPILVVAGALAVGWHLRERASTIFTDADTIRRPAEVARTRDVLWQPSRALSDRINSDESEYEPRLSADGMTLFFVRGKAGENAEILSSVRTPEGWTEPEPVAAISSEADELGPEPLADGRTLYFYSNRSGGLGGYDIWTARRSDDGWEAPVNLGPAVNSRHNEYGPAVAPDGSTLYFASNRPQAGDVEQPDPTAWPATVREEIHRRNYDVYSSAITERGAGRAVPVAILNSQHNDGAPAVSPAGDFVYFSSDRPGGEGGFDLYRARRLHGDHTAPENLGPAVNGPFNELDPALGMGGFALHFSSDREPTSGGEAADRDYDLYYTTSREVFTDSEAWRASIDWLALLPYLVWLLLTLLALLLLWLLSRFMGSVAFGRLGLLARCLLVSVLAHAMILFLLAFWGVGSSFSDWARDGRGTRVALVSPSVGNDLAAQIRGGLTELALEPSIEERRQVEVTPTSAAEAAHAALPVERVTVPVETLPVQRDSDDAPPPTLEAPEHAAAPAPSENAPPPALDAPAVQPGEAADEAAREAPVPEVRPVEQRRAAVATKTPARPAPAHLDPPATDPATARDTRSLVDSAAARDNASRVAPLPSPTGVDEPIELALDDARLETTLPAALEVESDAGEEPTRPLRDAPLRAMEAVPMSAPVAPPSSAAPVSLPPLEREADVAPPRLAVSAPREAPQSAPPESAWQPELPPTIEVTELGAIDLPDASDRAEAEPVEATLVVPDAIRDPVRGPIRREPALVAEPAETPRFTDDTALPRVPVEAHPLVATQRPTDDAAPRAETIPPRATAALPTPETPVEIEVAIPSAEQTSTYPSREPAAAHPLDLPDTERADLGGIAARPDAPEIPQFQSPAPPALTSLPDEPSSLFMADQRQEERRPISPPTLELVERAPVAAIALEPLDLDLPAEMFVPPNPQPQRDAERRQEMVAEMGGSEETEEAVTLALEWLARHQSPNGRWDGDDFDAGCGSCDGKARVDVDIALTGLALLSFHAAGHTHTSNGPYRETVKRGVEWMVEQQRRHGHLVGRESMYSQGIATIALAEAYGMTGDPELEPLLADAVRFIIEARNRRTGGWRYAPGQAGDTSVLGWQVMALSAAKHAGIDVPDEGFASAQRWLDRARSRRREGRYSYQANRSPTPAMTAEAVFVHQLIGRSTADPEESASIEYLLEHGPEWGRERSTYYLYYATLAIFQHGGEAWSRWNEQLKDVLVDRQVKTGDAAGSWELADQWAQTGGRIYQTAICTLTLEVYYRYLPQYMQATR